MGIHGLHRPRRWDAIAFVDLPSGRGDHVSFVALPDGTFVVEDCEASVPVEPFARSLDLPPAYRAEAVRRGDATWAVGAAAIDVRELRRLPLGDELEVVWDGRERSTRVDGAPSFVSVPELEELAAGRYTTWVARARRLRDAWWEVEVGPL